MHVYQSLLRCKIMYRTQKKTKKKVFTQYGTMFFVFGSKYYYLCCISVFSVKILQRVLGFPTFYGLSPFCTLISFCHLKKGFNQVFSTRYSNQKVRVYLIYTSLLVKVFIYISIRRWIFIFKFLGQDEST